MAGVRTGLQRLRILKFDEDLKIASIKSKGDPVIAIGGFTYFDEQDIKA